MFLNNCKAILQYENLYKNATSVYSTEEKVMHLCEWIHLNYIIKLNVDYEQLYKSIM